MSTIEHASERETKARAELRAIAEIVDAAAGEGVGFALFLEVDGLLQYVSNGHRAEVVTMLEEWFARTERTGSAQGEPDEGPAAVWARCALEEKCAEIGRTISGVTGMALFLFDFGPNGNLAYFTSLPGARAALGAWVRRERGRS